MSTGAAARGYGFQDYIAGALLLDVLFGETDSITVERETDVGDNFDDIVIERNEEKICIQCKNSSEKVLNQKQVFCGGEVSINKYLESGKELISADKGDKFVVLTSYRQEPSDLIIEECDNSFKLLGDFEVLPHTLPDGEGKIEGTNKEINYISGLPSVDEVDSQRELPPRKEDLFQIISEEVEKKLETHENPYVHSAEGLVTAALESAKRLRAQEDRKISGSEANHILNLTPNVRWLDEKSPINQDTVITPSWVKGLQQEHEWPNKRYLKGVPGSGKSTGIKLLEKSLEDIDDVELIRIHLYSPEDSADQAEKRLEISGFREQLIYNIREVIEDEDMGPSTPWIERSYVQEHLDSLAEYANERDKEILFVVDGVDHVLRPFGEGLNTEDLHDTPIKELKALDFPTQMKLTLVGRPSPEICEMLEIEDENIETISSWTKDELKEYLELREIDTTESLVDSVLESSGGLPVVVKHMISEAQERENPELSENLEMVLESKEDGFEDLDNYYMNTWEDLSCSLRDVLTLFALNPKGIGKSQIENFISFPWAEDSADLDSAPLASVLDENEGRFQLFHDSFRSFILGLDTLNEEKISEIHNHLFRCILDDCKEFPQDLEKLKYHAELSADKEKLRELADVDKVTEWWAKGAHKEHILKTLNIIFESSLNRKDYKTAFDCVVFGQVIRDMLDHKVTDLDRLRYYEAMDQEEKGIRLVEQILALDEEDTPEREDKSAKALIFAANNWPDKFNEKWLAKWAENHQNSDGLLEVQPKIFLELSAVTGSANFWDRVEENEEKFGLKNSAVLNALSENVELTEEKEEIPGWLLSDPEKFLEGTRPYSSSLSTQWKDQISSWDLNPEELSSCALISLCNCGYNQEEEILNTAKNRDLKAPAKRFDEDSMPYPDAFYRGIIFSKLGIEPDESENIIEELAQDQKKVQVLFSFIGAASNVEDDKEKWVNAALEFIIEIREKERLTESEEKSRRELRERYGRYIGRVVEKLSEKRLGYADSEIVERSLKDIEVTKSEDILYEQLTRALVDLRCQYYPETLSDRLEDIHNWSPEEETYSESILNLAVWAGNSGRRNEAEAYFKDAIRRGFRYGYRKDVLLADIWEGLKVTTDKWDEHQLGKAIRLANWARLLQDITDGKETIHYENKILTDLLEEDKVRFWEVWRNADSPYTRKKLLDWRMDNFEGITEDRLDTYIDYKINQIKYEQRGHEAPTYVEVEFFAKAAKIADEKDWADLANRALRAISLGDRITDGLDTNLENKIRNIAQRNGINLPNDLSLEDQGEDERGQDEDYEDELKQLLNSHDSDSPLTNESFEDFSDSKLKEAMKLIINDRNFSASIAKPLSREIESREDDEKAIQFIREVLSEKTLVSRHMAYSGDFKELTNVLIELEGEDALNTVLAAWKEDGIMSIRISGGIFPNIIWAVKQTEGDLAAEEFQKHAMKTLRMLMYPYENHTHQWGILDNPHEL